MTYLKKQFVDRETLGRKAFQTVEALSFLIPYHLLGNISAVVHT